MCSSETQPLDDVADAINENALAIRCHRTGKDGRSVANRRSATPVPSAACEYSVGLGVWRVDDQMMRRPSGVQTGAKSSVGSFVSLVSAAVDRPDPDVVAFVADVERDLAA